MFIGLGTEAKYYCLQHKLDHSGSCPMCLKKEGEKKMTDKMIGYKAELYCIFHDREGPCPICFEEIEVWRVDCDIHGLSTFLALGEESAEFCSNCVISLLDKHLPRLESFKVKQTTQPPQAPPSSGKPA